MTDKELLEFCKQHNVELRVRYDPDRSSYHLQMKRDWLQINYIFSQDCVDTAKAWEAIVKSKLDELNKKLAHVERAGEEENRL